jgi:hypothetical protein
VPSLTAITPPRTGKAIVGAIDHRAATEEIDGRGTVARNRRVANDALQNGPADGTVADIEGEFEIGCGGGSEVFMFFCLAYDKWFC